MKRNIRVRPSDRASSPSPSSSSLPAPVRQPGVSISIRIARARDGLRRVIERTRGPVGVFVRIAAAVAAIAGSVALARLCERHARTSPAFETRTVDIGGAERLTRDEVLAAAGLRVGQNVFVVPPEDAEARLLRHPWIANAHVERRLPGTYTIRLRERHAVAILALSSLYLVGDDATVFKRLAPPDPTDLPVVTGVAEEDLADLAERTNVLSSVVTLLDAWRTAGFARRAPLGEVHVEPDHGLTVWAGSDATLVRLGLPPYRAKLTRLRRVLDTLDAQHEHAEYVYLDNVRRPDRVTVRLRDRDLVAAVTPVRP